MFFVKKKSKKTVSFIFTILITFSLALEGKTKDQEKQIPYLKNSFKIRWDMLVSSLNAKQKQTIKRKVQGLSRKNHLLDVKLQFNSCSIEGERKLSKLLEYNRKNSFLYFLRGSGFELHNINIKKGRSNYKKCTLKIELSAKNKLEHSFQKSRLLSTPKHLKDAVMSDPINLEFDSKSYALKKEQVSLLLPFSNKIRKKNVHIMIKSYAYSKGHEKTKQLLSQARAYQVADFFLRNQISAKNISLKSFIIPTWDPFDYSQNKDVTNKESLREFVSVNLQDKSESLPIHPDPIKNYIESDQPTLKVPFNHKNSNLPKESALKILKWLDHLDQNQSYDAWIGNGTCSPNIIDKIKKILHFNRSMEIMYLISTHPIKLNQIENRLHARITLQINNGKNVYSLDSPQDEQGCFYYLSLMPIGKILAEKKIEKRKIQATELLKKESVYFAKGSYALHNFEQKYLEKVAEIILKKPENLVTLSGYADHNGAYHLNLELSKARALNVLRFLINLGVPSKILSFEFSPVTLNTSYFSSKKDAEKYRRVDIKTSPLGLIQCQEEIRTAKSKPIIYKKIETTATTRTRLDFLAGASSFKFGTSMGKYIKDTKSFMLGLNYQTNEDLNKKEKLFSTEFEWFSYTSYMKSKKVKSNKEHTSTLYLFTLGPQYRISFFNNHLNFFLSLGVGLCNWSSSIFDLNTKKDKSNQELSAAFPHGGGLDINLFGPLSLGARVMNNYLSLHSDNQYLEAHAFISWSQTLDP